MNRKWYAVGISVVVMAVISVIALVAMPETRREIFTRIVPVYNLYQTMSLRRLVREREFSEAAERLINHIELAKSLSRDRSIMVLGLVQATDLVLERARLQEEFDVLLPVLESIIEMEPDLYPGHLWLARALWKNDPERALTHVNAAIQLVNADDRAYRVGLNIALSQKNNDLVQSFCAQYAAAQFGGPLPRSYTNAFRGTGLRGLILSTTGTDGKSSTAVNLGLQLGERRTYSFNASAAFTGDTLSLHLGTLPGIDVFIHKVTLFGTDGAQEIPASNLTAISRSGYVTSSTEDALKITSIGMDDEEIRLRPTVGQFVETSQIDIEMSFLRLPLLNHPNCQHALTVQ